MTDPRRGPGRSHERRAITRRREDDLVAGYENLLEHGSRNFRRYRRRAYLAFAVLTTAAAISLGWLSRQAHEIQQQREQSIRAACVDSNRRHDETILRLDAFLARAQRTASPARLQRLRQSRISTVALIDALAPKHDCDAIVRRSVRTN